MALNPGVQVEERLTYVGVWQVRSRYDIRSDRLHRFIQRGSCSNKLPKKV